MNQIKSVADQLRNQLRAENSDKLSPLPPQTAKKSIKNRHHKNIDSPAPEVIDNFFREVKNYKIEISQKSMIRLDDRTMKLLKHIKLCKDIDMNRFIVFALHKFLSENPWLSGHIHETLKNNSL